MKNQFSHPPARAPFALGICLHDSKHTKRDTTSTLGLNVWQILATDWHWVPRGLTHKSRQVKWDRRVHIRIFSAFVADISLAAAAKACALHIHLYIYTAWLYPAATHKARHTLGTWWRLASPIGLQTNENKENMFKILDRLCSVSIKSMQIQREKIFLSIWLAGNRKRVRNERRWVVCGCYVSHILSQPSGWFWKTISLHVNSFIIINIQLL